MNASSESNVTDIEKMSNLIRKAMSFRSSGLKEYKLSDAEEKELRNLVTKKISYLKDANFDMIIDTGYFLVGADSIFSPHGKIEGHESAKV